jgi:26S proteasome regulatory subunit T1
MPSATGQSWEKYKKEFVDDEAPEKKITPLTDEYVKSRLPSIINLHD